MPNQKSLRKVLSFIDSKWNILLLSNDQDQAKILRQILKFDKLVDLYNIINISWTESELKKKECFKNYQEFYIYIYLHIWIIVLIGCTILNQTGLNKTFKSKKQSPMMSLDHDETNIPYSTWLIAIGSSACIGLTSLVPWLFNLTFFERRLDPKGEYDN